MKTISCTDWKCEQPQEKYTARYTLKIMLFDRFPLKNKYQEYKIIISNNESPYCYDKEVLQCIAFWLRPFCTVHWYLEGYYG